MIRSKNYNYARILYQQRVEAVKKIRQGKPQNKFNYVREGVIKSIVEETQIPEGMPSEVGRPSQQERLISPLGFSPWLGAQEGRKVGRGGEEAEAAA